MSIVTFTPRQWGHIHNQKTDLLIENTTFPSTTKQTIENHNRQRQHPLLYTNKHTSDTLCLYVEFFRNPFTPACQPDWSWPRAQHVIRSHAKWGASKRQSEEKHLTPIKHNKQTHCGSHTPCQAIRFADLRNRKSSATHNNISLRGPLELLPPSVTFPSGRWFSTANFTLPSSAQRRAISYHSIAGYVPFI